MTTTIFSRLEGRRRPGWGDLRRGRVRLPIATKLVLSFLVVIVMISVVFMVVGVRTISDRIVAEAQAKVRNDLNAAREIRLSELRRISDVVRFSADLYVLRQALEGGAFEQALAELDAIREREGLDVLSITDPRGIVLLRTTNPDVKGDSQRHDELVSAVLSTRQPAAGTTIISGEDLRRESAVLALQAHFKFIDTPKARPRPDTEQTAGMMLKAAAPVLDEEGRLIGVLYGGVLQNRNFAIVDKIKQTVYGGLQYKGKDIGTATIFQDDVRIATNVRNEDGSRAIRTRVSEEVYNRVVRQGKRWIDRAYVVNAWYIAAYEPIRNLHGDVIGILYVGILEDKYADIRWRTVATFLGITLLGAVAAMALGYGISRRISLSIRQLVEASRELARGNLDAKVEITTSDELQELAETFNTMAAAVKARDEQIKEYASRRVRKSERLAMVGQLAAGVAHELNNPMQGIVTYSMLLLEEMDADDPRRELVEGIVQQGNRCTQIVRGLLDFSRQRTPHRRPVEVGLVLNECLALVEKQVPAQAFHPRRVPVDHRARPGEATPDVGDHCPAAGEGDVAGALCGHRLPRAEIAAQRRPAKPVRALQAAGRQVD